MDAKAPMGLLESPGGASPSQAIPISQDREDHLSVLRNSQILKSPSFELIPLLMMRWLFHILLMLNSPLKQALVPPGYNEDTAK